MKKKATLESLAAMVRHGFNDVHKNTATKEELKGLATKVDLKGLASKEDLKGLASKEELEGLAGMVQRGFEEIKMTTKKDLREGLIETREVLSQKIDDLELHFSASTSHVREKVDHHGARIENLEERVDKLETKKAR